MARPPKQKRAAKVSATSSGLQKIHGLLFYEDKLKKVKEHLASLGHIEKKWAEISAISAEAYPKLFNCLTAQHPNLSPAELRLCALVRHGHCSKEIAEILGISPDSVKTLRSRLRKKMGLGRAENLLDYFLKMENQYIFRHSVLAKAKPWLGGKNTQAGGFSGQSYWPRPGV